MQADASRCSYRTVHVEIEDVEIVDDGSEPVAQIVLQDLLTVGEVEALRGIGEAVDADGHGGREGETGQDGPPAEDREVLHDLLSGGKAGADVEGEDRAHDGKDRFPVELVFHVILLQ